MPCQMQISTEGLLTRRRRKENPDPSWWDVSLIFSHKSLYSGQWDSEEIPVKQGGEEAPGVVHGTYTLK